MAEQGGAGEERSLEARVAGLEDRLSQMQVSEEEMKAYRKVSSLMGGAAAAPAAPNAGCVDCVVSCINECAIRQCTIVRQCTISQCIVQCVVRQCTIIRQCTISQCTYECYECGGGCAPGGPIIGGGGFGSLGG